MMSASVGESFLSKILESRQNLLNLAPSIVGPASFIPMPKAQKDWKTSSMVVPLMIAEERRDGRADRLSLTHTPTKRS